MSLPVVFAKKKFNPRRLFASGEQGVWFDPSDLTLGNMYQDSGKTLPVTGVEQPVGWIQDKSGRGNHAYQSTTTSRPTLRNLYNLLQRTEEFDNAVWGKAIGVSVTQNTDIAPDGTLTADTITGTSNEITQTVAVTNANYRPSVWVKKTTSATIYPMLAMNSLSVGSQVILNTNTGVATTRDNGTPPSKLSVTSDGSYWKISYEGAVTSDSFSYKIYPAASTDGVTYTAGLTNSVVVWGASLVPANEASFPYQRVVTNTLGSGVYDSDTTKFPPYLFFDGSDDSMSTNSIDFSATDKMSVFAGVRKLSDAAGAVLAELSSNWANSNGSFAFTAPDSAAAQYGIACKGSAIGYASMTTFAAPITNIVTQIYSIDGSSITDELKARANGADVTLTGATGGCGTGNFGNYPLYIGARNNASSRLNGRIYSLIVRGALTETPLLEKAERWVATKTGVTL